MAGNIQCQSPHRHTVAVLPNNQLAVFERCGRHSTKDVSEAWQKFIHIQISLCHCVVADMNIIYGDASR